MLRALDAALFYLTRWLDEERAKRDALAELKKNHWRCIEVERMKKNKSYRSYRRADYAYHR